MCGIFGVCGKAVDDNAALAALEAIAARGPDGASFARIQDKVLLGHTRLSIIDLDDHANQPMYGLGRQLAIVFNGEIYNAPQLRAAIGDYPWTTDHSDTEAILAAYWRFGEDFLSHLQGMFAFALWDKSEAKLILAVDRFSIKPLLIANHASSFYFASNAAALGALGVPLLPYLPAVHSWLADGQLETSAATFFSGIDQIPAAHFAVLRSGELRLKRYWSPPLRETRSISAVEIESWLRESLTSHLLSDVPVGINLSSGIDSGVLRALAASGGTTLHGFTFSFPGTPYDEAARLKALIGDNKEWSTTAIDANEMWRDFPSATRALESPLGGVAIYGHWRNGQTARAAGYKVLLAGEGADEVFGGYKYYAEEAIKATWRAGQENEAEALFQDFARRDPAEWRGSAAQLVQAPVEGRLRAPDGTSLARSFLTNSFSRTEKLSDPPMQDGDAVRATMWADLAYLKLPKLLRWQDRCYMASGIEIRVPFLDHILIERMAALGWKPLFAGGLTKSVLRRMAAALLPSEFLSQPKLYVATPQREWMKSNLRRQVEDMLDSGAMLVSNGIIDLPALRKAYKDYAAEPSLGNSFFIWKYVAMEFMFQCFFRTSQQDRRIA